MDFTTKNQVTFMVEWIHYQKYEQMIIGNFLHPVHIRVGKK